MKITTINQNTPSFKGANLNINALSDTHGQLGLMENLCAKIEENKQDIFLKEKEGNKNVFIVAGDWFMAGDVKGYKTNPDWNSQKYQLVFLNKLIHFIHTLSRHCEIIFSVGNHEFDAGEKEFSSSMDKIHGKIIMTNVNLENSPELSELNKKKKITKSQIIKIKDDKNPFLSHEVLFISTIPSNMSYYNKKLKGIDFSDNVNKAQSKLNPDDFKNSLYETEKEIKDFKQKNKKGVVILLDHFAGEFQKELLKKNLPINVILSAHEHEDEKAISGNTLIVKLSQNFLKLENIKIKFDDDGNIEEIKTKSVRNDRISKQKNVEEFYNKLFKKDLEQKYIIPSSDNVSLTLDGIRFENNYLANYITDVIFYKIKQYYPEVDIFALNSSSIRGSLLTQNEGQINNTHLVMTLNGIKEEDANILISKVTGLELLEIICDNILFNDKNHQKNPLLQYSGIKINKNTMLALLKKGMEPSALCNLVKTTKDNKPVDLTKTYYLANVEKLFNKTKFDLLKNIYKSNRTHKTNLNAKELFKSYFEEGNNAVVAKKEERYY